ncbi:hemolysin activation/secretion protein [Roseateles toxinivorans]|uniref:Hemolysin activation/secretion protein n=1 Tax=Roseateles toxinivorans TaxID=270368 RepID=A0A4R6QLH3_9BURK|nr:hemolysin activation/secretion protein [Roseateles toxinivorans]
MNAFSARVAQALGAILFCCLLLLSSDGRANAQAPASVAETPRFDILEFEIEGNTVLPLALIERAVLPYLGLQKQMLDVEAARAELDKAYQSAGFLTVFVDVPEQRIDGGLVRLKVVEGRVERLSVTGARYYSQGQIRATVTELADGQVPNFNTVQRQLAQLNRSEDRRVQPVLRPGRLPGTVEAELQVTDKLPLSGSVELHNGHADGTDPTRLSANVRYDNLFQLGHGVSLTGITAPQKPAQSKVLVLNYSLPMEEGRTLTVYGVASDSAVESLGGTAVLGKGTTLGLRYAMPVQGPENSYHNLTLGADYKDLKERVSFGDGSISTPLRYLPMQVAYSGGWSASERSQTQLGATLTFGLRRLLARNVDDCPRADGTFGPADQFACKRKGADGGFNTLRLDLRHSQRFALGEQALGTVAMRLTGQIANQALTSAEQFSVGGAETVRGYLEGAASGDYGLLGSLEWRSPNFASRWFTAPEGGTALINDLTLLGFIDVARTYVFDPDVGQAAHVSLLGAGVGLRLAGRHGLSLSLDAAQMLKRLSAQGRREARLHARLAYRF